MNLCLPIVLVLERCVFVRRQTPTHAKRWLIVGKGTSHPTSIGRHHRILARGTNTTSLQSEVARPNTSLISLPMSLQYSQTLFLISFLLH